MVLIYLINKYQAIINKYQAKKNDLKLENILRMIQFFSHYQGCIPSNLPRQRSMTEFFLQKWLKTLDVWKLKKYLFSEYQ